MVIFYKLVLVKGSEIMIWTHGRVFYEVNVCRWYSFSTLCIIWSVNIYCPYHIKLNSKSIFIIRMYILIWQHLVDYKLYASFAYCVFGRDSFINLSFIVHPTRNKRKSRKSLLEFILNLYKPFNIYWSTRIFSSKQMKCVHIIISMYGVCIYLISYVTYNL